MKALEDFRDDAAMLVFAVRDGATTDRRIDEVQRVLYRVYKLGAAAERQRQNRDQRRAAAKVKP